MSSTNPFRPVPPTPVTTESLRLADPSSDAAQHEHIPPRMIQRKDSLGLTEEMPPAYTPSADVYHGESTVEVGPQRSFQQPPRPTHRPSHSTPHSQSPTSSLPQPPPRPQSQPQQHPQQSAWITPTPSSGPNSWSMYSGQRHERRGGGLVGAILDTVRDAVSSVHDEMRVVPQARTGVHAAPYAESFSSGLSQSHYAPSHQGVQGQVPAVPSMHHTPQRQIPDDGSPTRTPAPGHPLLNNGNILVYPNKDHICIKCPYF